MAKISHMEVSWKLLRGPSDWRCGLKLRKTFITLVTGDKDYGEKKDKSKSTEKSDSSEKAEGDSEQTESEEKGTDETEEDKVKEKEQEHKQLIKG